MFAMILDEKYLVKLRKPGSLTVTSGKGAFPTDYLKSVKDPHVTVDGGDVAKFIPETERWRLRFLAEGASAAPSAANDIWYYYEDSTGVNVIPANTATAINYPYIAIPTDLGVSENLELPDAVNDMTVEYAFEKCMGTTRGDKELAVYLAKKRGMILSGF